VSVGLCDSFDVLLTVFLRVCVGCGLCFCSVSLGFVGIVLLYCVDLVGFSGLRILVTVESFLRFLLLVRLLEECLVFLLELLLEIRLGDMAGDIAWRYDWRYDWRYEFRLAALPLRFRARGLVGAVLNLGSNCDMFACGQEMCTP
jgi:hypothetical protein